MARNQASRHSISWAYVVWWLNLYLFRNFDRNAHLSFYYFVFGLLLRSNLPLNGLPLADTSLAPPDVEVHVAVAPAVESTVSSVIERIIYESPDLDADGHPALRIWYSAQNNGLRLAFSDGTQFWFDRSRRHLWAAWPKNLSLDSTLSYLLGPVMGLLLRLRGVTCLHASAVALNDCGVLFVGSAGAGKSTTAAAFAKMGYAIIADDIVALSTAAPVEVRSSAVTRGSSASGPQKSSAFYALPAYPYLSLWPDSVKMLYGSEATLPVISPDWDKCRLSLGTAGTRFESRSLPVGAIYLIAARGLDPAPHIRPARGQTSLVSLLANTYANNLLDRTMRAAEFAVLDRLVASVPIRVLTPHQDPARIAQLCEGVRQDLYTLGH